MSTKEEIADSIRKIAGTKGFDTDICKVTNVDPNKASCDVIRIKDNKKIPGVRINASVLNDDGIVITPAKDSYVLVTKIDDRYNYVSLYSTIDKITVGSKKKPLEVVINGGENEGLVKIKELTDKLNELVDWCENHTHLIPTSGVSVEGTMGNAANTDPIDVPSPSNTPKKFKKKDYENNKITH